MEPYPEFFVLYELQKLENEIIFLYMASFCKKNLQFSFLTKVIKQKMSTGIILIKYYICLYTM